MAGSAAARGRGGIAIAAAGLVSLAAAGTLFAERASGRERARAGAATELGAFQRCLMGEPLRPGETLGGRLRGVELALALHGAVPEEQVDGGARDGGGNPEEDASAIPLSAAADAWPARCAPFAEALARQLDETGDPRLDALREALPSRARFSLPYALMADEAAELAAAIDQAGLPPPQKPADNEPPPAPLAAPLATAGLTALGKGRLSFAGHGFLRGLVTDLLATSTVHLLLDDGRARACAMARESPAGPYGVARCGDLPEWMDTPSFPVLDDGAPLAVNARRATHRGAQEWLGGILVFTPAGMRAIPINAARNGSSDFIAADGSYIIPGYAPLVRLGKVEALRSDDLGAPTADRTVSALDPAIDDAIAAYGMVFFDDRPPLYTSFDPDRRFWGRRVSPVYDPAPTDLGPASASNLHALGGCRVEGRTALLFDTVGQYAANLKKARLVLAEGTGPLHRIDADTGTTAPFLHCGRDAVFVTSVEPARPGFVVVVESRCAGTVCQTRRSDPVAIPLGEQVQAATLDGGVVITWVTQKDQVTSPARGMAFYRFAPLDALAAAPPRPLLEGARRGGVDVVAINLVPRPMAAIVALETGGKTPVTYAVRIDAAGTAAAVRMEETKW